MNRLQTTVYILTCIFLTLACGYLGEYPPGCDETAAGICEYNYLYCKLFEGPANDPVTLCNCGAKYYGECITNAGCLLAYQVGKLTTHEIYMKVCIDSIITNDCPSVLQCGINCASDGQIDISTSKIIPFNNYGKYYLRIKVCLKKVHAQKLSRYSYIDISSCQSATDFNICNRWIPPQTFVPVAIPKNTTYIEVDYCSYVDGVYSCSTSISSSRIYGNDYQFPTSFDVSKSNASICSSNDDCLGSYCDFHQRPPYCSAKSQRQISQSGKYYFSDPFD